MNREQQATEFLSWLKGQIPIINHMGFTPLEWDGRTLKMGAQLQPNVNDKGTGFGGSLATVATLCGWSIVTLHLRDLGRDDDVVIKESHLEYFRPVTSDFTAMTVLPYAAVLDKFATDMSERGRARMELVVEINQGAETALRLTGTYVAMARKQPRA